MQSPLTLTNQLIRFLIPTSELCYMTNPISRRYGKWTLHLAFLILTSNLKSSVPLPITAGRVPLQKCCAHAARIFWPNSSALHSSDTYPDTSRCVLHICRNLGAHKTNLCLPAHVLHACPHMQHICATCMCATCICAALTAAHMQHRVL